MTDVQAGKEMMNDTTTDNEMNEQENATGPEVEEEAEPSSPWWNRLKIFLALVILGVGVYLFIEFDLRSKFQHTFKHTITPWIDAHPVTGPLAYAAIYIAAVVAFLPGSVVTLAGGALFGPLWGTIIVSLASTTGAGLAFLLGRFLGKSWLEKKAGDRIETIQEGIRKDGWRYVAFTRLVPIFPFNLQNYVYGLTRIGFWTYLGVSWVAMLPGTFAYVYAGYAAKELAAGGGGVKKTFIVISIAAGILILVSFIPNMIKKNASDTLEVDALEEDEETK